MKTVYITEEQKHKLGLILEDKEGKNLAKARRYLELNGYNNSQQRQQILDSIRTDIPNSRLQQCKFILGVVRLYINRQLSDGQSIAALNKTLKYIASDTHVNEYDNNLNNESLQTLVNRFKGVAKDDLQQSMAASNARQLTVNQEYNIVPIDNPKEASKYGKYTSWCVTHDSNMYDSYTANGTGRFYFCLRNGFEKEPKVEGEGCPLDSYGLSMIAVSITMEGEVNTITCRWNHDMNGNDNIMNIEQLEDLLGRNFYQTFKPYTREELHAKGIVLFDEVQGLLDSGKKPEEIFDECYGFREGFAVVILNYKYNYISREGKILSSQWFDWCDDFREGFARVRLNDKYNYISREGKILSSQWFDWCDDFREGFARVRLNDKYNYISREGKILSSQWFYDCGDFREGFARVQLNDKFNYISREGKILSSQWFDGCGNFSEGFGRVTLNDKMNFINSEGKILSSQWFDGCGDFREGFAWVYLNGKFNYISREGKLLSSQWFDDCYDFRKGFAWVKLNGNRYKIDRTGRPYNEDGSPLSESKKDRRTVYITEEQAKHLKKKLSAQDQVGGKVNAGVMDAVVGGMCEDVEDDKFVLGTEMNAPIGGVYYHVKEGKINESPDYVDFFDVKWRTDGSYPFMYLLSTQEFYVGKEQETHMQTIYRYAPEIFKELEDEEFKIDYEKYVDTTLTGRYWKEYNVISFWKTPIDKRMNVRKVVDVLKEQGIIQSSEYTVLDYWDNNTMSNCVFPIKWLFNGTYDMFAGRCSRITPIKLLEYLQTGKYSYFQVTTNGSGIQCVNVSGNEILTVMEYYMQSSISEGRKKVVKNDKGEIVPEKCDKCGGKVVLQIHGEPVYVCKDCGKYFGTMPFHRPMDEEKLNENSNDRKVNDYIKRKFGITDFQDIRNKVMEIYKVIPYARIFSGRYLLGVMRLVFEENIPRTDYAILNKILYTIYLDWHNIGQRLDSNLNNLSIEGLSKFTNVNIELTPTVNYVKKIRKVKNGYTIIHVESFEEMDLLCDGEWCISNSEGSWDELINDDDMTVYLVQNEKMIDEFDAYYEQSDNREEWYKIREPMYDDEDAEIGNFKDGGAPYDLYGLSRFVVLISEWGVSGCYSRYNIPNCLDGDFLNEKELTELLGIDAKEAFPYVKPNPVNESRDYSKWLEQLKQRRDPDNIEENIENEISPEDVDLSSFNIKRKLNPKFWVDGHLDSRIRLKLMDISDDFIEYLGIDPHIVKDVLMTGSLANFNWSEEFSDIDLHVLLDYSDVDENTEFVKQYFMSQKNSWNNEHGDIKIFGFPVEVYVQDVNEKHDSSGVYSLDKDKWLVEPDRDVLATSKVNKAFIKDKVSDYTNKIDKLIYLYEKAKDDEYKLGKIAEKANVLWDEIKNSRKKGFEISNGKEINNFNIIFKTLRRFDYLDKLYQLKTKTYNKLNSIE